ncbi:MAG: F0F1 ATP synthase subunit B [Phycisphaerales bacterium]
MFLHTLAAEGGSPVAFKIAPYIFAIVVAGTAFFILTKFVWPRIISGLDEREAKILGEIKNAESARADAEKAKSDFESALAGARKEAADMVAQARADAKAAGDDAKARNERELADMKQRARTEIDAARQEAVASIHAEAATLATAIAGKILQREISVDDQQRLLDESLKELAGTRN